MTDSVWVIEVFYEYGEDSHVEHVFSTEVGAAVYLLSHGWEDDGDNHFTKKDGWPEYAIISEWEVE